MKILALCKKNSGVDYHRIILPLRYMQKITKENYLFVYQDHYLTEEAFKNIDIVIYSRQCPYDLKTIKEFKQKHKFKLIVDVDDYWILDSTHPFYDYWERSKIYTNIIESLLAADLVTTTTEALRDRVLPYNKNIGILPNALPYGEEQFNSVKYYSTIKKIMYACSPTHYFDLKQIEPFFGMCRNNSNIQRKFQLVLAGYDKTGSAAVKDWDKLESVVSTYGNYSIAYNLDLEHYMNHYSDAALSIAPLYKNNFNLYKSNLKILEAGCKKIPIIVSDYGPYRFDNCQGIKKCKTNKDWYSYVLYYLNNPEKLIEDGEKLYDYVNKNYNLNTVNEQRIELFKTL